MFTSECILEPVARAFRFKKSLPYLKGRGQAVILDLGCGPNLHFYNFLEKSGLEIQKYIAVDPLLRRGKIPVSRRDRSRLTILKINLERKLPFKDATVDCIVGFAFLEHIDYPNEIMEEAIRILKKGGRIVFTAPTPRAKLLLEKVLTRLGLISQREVREHKRYFNKDALLALLSENSRKKVKISHHYFELGLNNLLVIEKV